MIGCDPVEVVELEVDLRLSRDREEVEHTVRRAAGCGDRRDRVLEIHVRSSEEVPSARRVDRIERGHAACDRERATRDARALNRLSS